MSNVVKIYRDLRAKAAFKHPVAAEFSLHVRSGIHDSERHYAESGHGSTYVAPEISKLKASKIKAILAHEIAHLLVKAKAAPQHPDSATYDQIERNADRVAEAVFGIPIYYDAQGIEDCAFDPSFKRPRPPGLR